MDYSVPTDTDQLAGPSPWDSPKANRNSFPPSNDVPASPVLPSAQSPYPTAQGSPTASRYHENLANAPLHNQNAIPVDDDLRSADFSGQQHSVQHERQDYDGQQSQPQQAQQFAAPQQQQQQQRPGAARYQQARQQRPVPQYKLQAKITALERTGRKDPVLRFDVYVCCIDSMRDYMY